MGLFLLSSPSISQSINTLYRSVKMGEQMPMLSIHHPLGSRTPRRVPLDALCPLGFDKYEHTEKAFLSLKLSVPHVFLPHPVPSNHGPSQTAAQNAFLLG